MKYTAEQFKSLLLEGASFPSEEIFVEGNLCFRGTQIIALPNNLSIYGDLDLVSSQIAALPNNLIVSGRLYLGGTQTPAIPGNLSVGSNLYLDLEGAQTRALPNGRSIGGVISISTRPSCVCGNRKHVAGRG